MLLWVYIAPNGNITMRYLTVTIDSVKVDEAGVCQGGVAKGMEAFCWSSNRILDGMDVFCEYVIDLAAS